MYSVHKSEISSNLHLDNIVCYNKFCIISGPENTFVVLPAAPYIFPQRPFILPTVPPAFVLVDSNLQTLNKSPFPIVNRINGDVTKTTMVNILPISAYSRPLSATRNRKNNTKSKLDNLKRTNKKPKQSTKITKEHLVNEEPTKSNDLPTKETTKEQNDLVPTDNSKTKESEITKNTCNKDKNSVSNSEYTKLENKHNTSIDKDLSMKQADALNVTKPAEILNIPKRTDHSKITESSAVDKTLPVSTPLTIIEKDNGTKIIQDKLKDTNKTLGKDSVNKDKENKLSHILDTALCENTVDGGNARLELAEEFLAASPTAAFLMSFPLVSGNRADSPAEDPHTNPQVTSKDSHTRRHEVASQTINYYEKTNTNDSKPKSTCKAVTTSSTMHHSKQNEHQKYTDNHVVSKQAEAKHSNNVVTTTSNENPFLNLSMSSLIPPTCTLSDSSYALDFDCTISKTIPSQTTSYVNSSNLFYKSDPFSTVKNTIYSTSSISSGHEFNSFGLYPCAMEKYASKTKSDYPNVEDNLMKIGSSRLTYDIDLGWSHKGFDFVNCTSAPNAFSKENILNTTSTSYSSSYNPFNPEFHIPLVSTSGKKDASTNKASSSFAETFTSFYSQPTSLWSEDMSYYNNSNNSKAAKSHHYLPVDHSLNNKVNNSKIYETKQMSNVSESIVKTTNVAAPQQVAEKYTKKSPTKMHINWMTSEVRPMQSHCNPPHLDTKEVQKHSYSQLDHTSKKVDPNEGNYFPISMHNFSSQITQDELQIWPSARPAGTTEITMEPPPINLPTLVGDLALGPHDKKKTDISSRSGLQTDLQNCSNSFFVTQLMNRTTDNSLPSRYQGSEIEISKSVPVKQNSTQTTTELNHKTMSRIESHISQPYYVFHEGKSNSYETMSQYPQTKAKPNKPDKSSKVQKNSYSAEALIRGGTCNQKLPDTNSSKFAMPPQKYSDFNTAQDSVAQVSHFPPILDYSDNSSYTGQQFSATTLYNSTTNTISNSFYTNFMPGSSNLMSGNYTSGPFSGDFIDYNQTTECNYSNHKYEELKMRNNSSFHPEKVPYKGSRRESATKHKLECAKKDSNKKYQSKRAKLNTEVEDWNESAHLLWQNKTPTKKHHNLMSEDIPFPNYVSNQMPGQYQPDYFNSHLMPSNMQSMGHNVDRSLASFPATSRANFNLSTIFPEITMVS